MTQYRLSHRQVRTVYYTARLKGDMATKRLNPDQIRAKFNTREAFEKYCFSNRATQGVNTAVSMPTFAKATMQQYGNIVGYKRVNGVDYPIFG